MFNFLLKKKTGFGCTSVFGTLSLFFGIVLSFLSFYFFNFFENKITYIFLIIFFQISSLIIIELIYKEIKKYRSKTPYKIYTIKEDNKEFEVRDYPTLYMREYYYNGKLHRESGLAVELYGFYTVCTKHGNDSILLNNLKRGFFFLNGKKQTYEEFVNNVDKIKIQNKALSF